MNGHVIHNAYDHIRVVGMTLLCMAAHAFTRRKMNKKVVSSNGKNLVTKRSQSNEEHYPSVCECGTECGSIAT